MRIRNMSLLVELFSWCFPEGEPENLEDKPVNWLFFRHAGGNANMLVETCGDGYLVSVETPDCIYETFVEGDGSVHIYTGGPLSNLALSDKELEKFIRYCYVINKHEKKA